ncbi:MAG TPA: biotin carboxylase N-terminal domain-containing protein [Candidatus Kapabacteria bacterium]|nr:biotin carboxylase N-terminal domain-containing protein [Candidatus Kapabacteria bacterium]
MKRISKILIANRGEIACRIIQTCKEQNIKCVAIYSKADENALHRILADEAIFIGESLAKESYLNVTKIIQIAKDNNCDAIHPGYGFLSENWEFNKRVTEEGIIFIGPNFEAMRLLGSKTESRETMISNNIPVVPGWKSKTANWEEYLEEAKKIGFPILIKSSGGGGGKGMRDVWNSEDFQTSFEAAQRESLSSFGNSEVFIEKLIENPRHIEFQVVADHFGNYIHLNERECSIQRRHQKIIEETPSLALNTKLREEMGQIAIKACKVAKYDNIGTVEFLLDASGKYYFLEVNARIQVEHPITEETTGYDLVKIQIDISSGLELQIRQEEVYQQGHSIECRIYAEDGNNNFMPAAGKILLLKEPKGKGIRYDTGIYEGFEVPIYYDPIMAKLIVKGADREEARLRIIKALKDNVILGITTSIEYLINILESDKFIAGDIFTDTISKDYAQFITGTRKYNNIAIASCEVNNSKRQYDFKEQNDTILNVSSIIGDWEIAR